jgi:hypothetical protein
MVFINSILLSRIQVESFWGFSYITSKTKTIIKMVRATWG